MFEDVAPSKQDDLTMSPAVCDINSVIYSVFVITKITRDKTRKSEKQGTCLALVCSSVAI